MSKDSPLPSGSQEPNPSPSSNDLEQLASDLYGQLKQLAKQRFRGQPPSHTLQPTALVHEALMKLKAGDYQWESEEHFLAFASKAMRSILVDHARHKNREKNRPSGERVFLDDLTESYESAAFDILALDEALKNLGKMDPGLVAIVELKFFAGLTMPEISKQLGRAQRSVEQDWTFARRWLYSQLASPE